MEDIRKPEKRSLLRRRLGREFYILKRRLRWLADGRKYVKRPGGRTLPAEESFPHVLISHRSHMLRPLKDVDMYLQHNKVTNLRLALSGIDGAVLEPGSHFSLWRLVGRPSRRKGYLDGLVIHNGEISKGVGGGLCQLGNLLYWMVLHTELTVTERWRHSFDVFPDVNRTIPFACGATLGYNYLDLGFANHTDARYLIRLWQEGEYLHGEIRCDRASAYRYEIFETDHSMRHQWWGGYTRHNRIWKRRTSIADGTEEVIPVSENHAIMMYEPLLPGGEG